MALTVMVGPMIIQAFPGILVGGPIEPWAIGFGFAYDELGAVLRDEYGNARSWVGTTDVLATDATGTALRDRLADSITNQLVAAGFTGPVQFCWTDRDLS